MKTKISALVMALFFLSTLLFVPAFALAQSSGNIALSRDLSVAFFHKRANCGESEKAIKEINSEISQWIEENKARLIVQSIKPETVTAASGGTCVFFITVTVYYKKI